MAKYRDTLEFSADILDRLHSEGKTLIVVTHDEGIAAQAERIIRLFDGRIVQEECNRQ